jgi:hypothetical protein
MSRNPLMFLKYIISYLWEPLLMIHFSLLFYKFTNSDQNYVEFKYVQIPGIGGQILVSKYMLLLALIIWQTDQSPRQGRKLGKWLWHRFGVAAHNINSVCASTKWAAAVKECIHGQSACRYRNSDSWFNKWPSMKLWKWMENMIEDLFVSRHCP